MRGDLPISLQVLLVAEDKEWKIMRILRHAFLEEIRAPAFQVVKALRVGDVKNEDACLSTAVESGTKRLVTLLACCVPQL